MNAIYNPVYTVYIRHIYARMRARAHSYLGARKRKKRPTQAVKRPFFGFRVTLHTTKRNDADGAEPTRERVQGARYKRAKTQESFMYNVRKVARFSRVKTLANSRELQQITDPKQNDGSAVFLYKKDDRKLAGRLVEGKFCDLRRVGVEAAIVLRDDVLYTFNATTQLETTDDARTLDRGNIALAFYLGKHKVYTIDATEFKLAAEIVCHEVGLRVPFEEGRHACPCMPKKECPTTVVGDSAPKKAESKPKKAKSERQKSKASAKKARATRRAKKATPAPKKATPAPKKSARKNGAVRVIYHRSIDFSAIRRFAEVHSVISRKA